MPKSASETSAWATCPIPRRTRSRTSRRRPRGGLRARRGSTTRQATCIWRGRSALADRARSMRARTSSAVTDWYASTSMSARTWAGGNVLPVRRSSSRPRGGWPTRRRERSRCRRTHEEPHVQVRRASCIFDRAPQFGQGGRVLLDRGGPQPGLVAGREEVAGSLVVLQDLLSERGQVHLGG